MSDTPDLSRQIHAALGLPSPDDCTKCGQLGCSQYHKRTRQMLPAETPADHPKWHWATDTTPRPEFVAHTLPADWRPDGDPHVTHFRMEMRKLVGECKPCARRKLAWMDEQPRSGHIHRAAVRFHRLYDEVLR